MLEISELIYETCKTYLIQQGKFLLILEAVHRRHHRVSTSARWRCSRPVTACRCKVAIILLFSLVGIAGSYGVAWFGIRVNTFANSPHGVRQPARQAVSRATRFRSRPA